MKREDIGELSVAVAFGLVASAAAVLAGCNPTAPVDNAERARLGAWLALHIAKVGPPQKVPSPDTPDQGDKCPDCDGTGRLPGDGVVRPICTTCNGTGRRPAADFDPPASANAFEGEMLRREAVAKAAAQPPAAPKLERYAAPPKDGRTYRKVCRGGECAWEPIP